nr:helix-turn-helix transcriptional regulator [Alicyclobacillus sendaiensis]
MTRVELVRRMYGITQTQLAKQIGVARPQLSELERGTRRPSPKLRRSIAGALGFREEVLFNDGGWPIVVNNNDWRWLSEHDQAHQVG